MLEDGQHLQQCVLRAVEHVPDLRRFVKDWLTAYRCSFILHSLCICAFLEISGQPSEETFLVHYICTMFAQVKLEEIKTRMEQSFSQVNHTSQALLLFLSEVHNAVLVGALESIECALFRNALPSETCSGEKLGGEVADTLYDRVRDLEPELSPKITGL